MARRGPEPIGNILPELMARRGYAGVQTARAYEAAWREAAGPLLARYTRVGALRRGALEVTVANSTLVQEIGFQKAQLLHSLSRLLPDQGINDLRFRVGAVGECPGPA
ncbi:MAG: DUF721 domain-containing protein [Thermoguttaceae bacterium]